VFSTNQLKNRKMLKNPSITVAPVPLSPGDR